MSDISVALRLIQQRQPACGITTVVAIDGPSGSGKSVLADHLARRLSARVVRLDDLYRGWHDLATTPPRLAADLLGPVSIGELGRTARWDWENHETSDDLVLAPGGLVLLDGVGSASAPIRPFLSAIVWVEAPISSRKDRALARDGDTYEPWWDVWAAQESSHYRADPTRRHADLVVDTGARMLTAI